eukprot:5416447-Prymnesium_polylepis.1
MGETNCRPPNPIAPVGVAMDSCYAVGGPRPRDCRHFTRGGLWPMVRHKAVLERYAALRGVNTARN